MTRLCEPMRGESTTADAIAACCGHVLQQRRTRHAGPALACILTLLVGATAGAQPLTPGQTLTQTGALRFGAQMDVSGNTLVVGAPGESVGGAAGQGAAYVYVRSGASWVLQQRLTASDGGANHGFGIGVAISGDTVVVGAELAPGGGAAYAFVRTGTTWTEQQKLLPPVNGATLTGQRVAIEGDTILVGSRGASSTGRAFVFERVGTTWVAQPSLAPPASPVVSNFGADVAISGDTACVTADISERAYVFTRSGGAWSLQQTLSETATNRFGGACAVLGDTLVVGSYLEAPSGAGAAYVYRRSGGAFVFEQRLAPPSLRNNDRFGVAVDLEVDRLIVGAAAFSQPGRAYVFDRNGSSWTERQFIDRGVISFSRDNFGIDVVWHGTSVVVGASDVNLARAFGPSQSGPPGPPTGFQATVSGNTVTMGWSAPTSGGAPTGYTIVARTTGGQLLATLPVGSALGLSVGAPNGVYSVSVVATNAAGTGVESNAVTVTVPSTTPVPGNPTNLAVMVTGNSALFTWTPPTTGGAVASYLLLAGSSPSFVTPSATLPLPASPASTTIGSIPPGSYWVRLLAVNAGGTSAAASNEVNVVVAGPMAPGAPTMNAAMVSGSTVSLSWTAGGGGAPTSYVVTAAATAGGPTIATLPVGGTSVSVPNVPAGTYFVKVTAVNGVGSSPASNEITVVVP